MVEKLNWVVLREQLCLSVAEVGALVLTSIGVSEF